MIKLNQVPGGVNIVVDMTQYNAMVAEQVALKQDFDAAMSGVNHDDPMAVMAAMMQVFGPGK
jgi:hypothetical protein